MLIAAYEIFDLNHCNVVKVVGICSITGKPLLLQWLFRLPEVYLIGSKRCNRSLECIEEVMRVTRRVEAVTRTVRRVEAVSREAA